MPSLVLVNGNVQGVLLCSSQDTACCTPLVITAESEAAICLACAGSASALAAMLL